MYALFDNLNALLIGGTVMMLLLTVYPRVQDMRLEQTATYVVKQQANDFATWAEEDLLKMGANMDLGEVLFENPVDSAGLTTRFTFYRDSVIATGVEVRLGVRYDLHHTGTRILGADTLDAFQVRRHERMGSGSWMPAGNGPARLSAFRIELLNRDMQPIVNPASATAVVPDTVHTTRLRFAMLSPFDAERSTLRQLYYGSTLMVKRDD